MAANAPYYQIPSGQFIASTNATQSQFVSEDDEYDLSAAAAALPHEHHSASYSESTAHQTLADTPMTSTEENHNLAELLQAATTAAGQAAQAMDAHDAVTASAMVQGKGKRRGVSSSPAYDSPESPTSDDIAAKRRRVDVPTDPQLQSAEHARDKSQSASVPPSSESRPFPSLLRKDVPQIYTTANVEALHVPATESRELLATPGSSQGVHA
jgi:hypothetical protein